MVHVEKSCAKVVFVSEIGEIVCFNGAMLRFS